MGPYTIGFDLGGTKMLCLLVDAKGAVEARVKGRTEGEGNARHLVETLLTRIEEVLARAEVEQSEISGVGVGVPGAVDFRAGRVIDLPNLGIQDFPLKAVLEKKLKLPVTVDNDVNAGTYGEHLFGAAKSYRDVIGVFPGTGIGGGLILDGRLYRGAFGAAGEVGHMIVQIEGRRCGCGQLGCLEALASRTAIAKDLVGEIAAGRAPRLKEECGNDFTRIRSGAISRAAAAGEKTVVESVKQAAHVLGIGIANLVNIIDPEAVVIGGGLIEKLGDSYLNAVDKSLRTHLRAAVAKRLILLKASLGDDAVAVGASLLVRNGA